MNLEKLPTVSIPIITMEMLEKIVERILRKLLDIKLENQNELLLTTKEVCEKFKVSRITLNTYRKENKLLPFSKAGKQYSYRMCDCIKAFKHRLSSIPEID